MTWKYYWVFLLLALPLAYVVYAWIFSKTQKGTFLFSSQYFLKNIVRGMRSRLVVIPLILKLLAAVLIIVALARPQESNTKIKRNVEGIDIMISLDISDSMLIEDMRPINRMESAKKTILHFISKRLSDRIGVIVFSGEAYTRVPLTLDYDILKDSVKKIEPERTVKMGTAIGVALASAVGRIKESTAKSRVVILLTDGENNSGTIDPLTALEIAKGFNIRVYTIGVGQDGEAQLPVYQADPFGRKIKTYQPILSKVNDDLLNRIAQETGGKYFRASTGNSLQGVFNEIDRLEKTKIEVNKYTKYSELFQKYLKWAAIFYILAVFLEYSILRRGP